MPTKNKPNKPEIETKIKNKSATGIEQPDKLPAELGTEVSKKAAEKQEIEKEGLREDPTIEQKETKKAEETNKSQLAAKKKEEAKVAKETAKMKAPDQVRRSTTDVIEESEELVEAVTKDAESRGKTVERCVVTGVLIAT